MKNITEEMELAAQKLVILIGHPESLYYMPKFPKAEALGLDTKDEFEQIIFIAINWLFLCRGKTDNEAYGRLVTMLIYEIASLTDIEHVIQSWYRRKGENNLIERKLNKE